MTATDTQRDVWWVTTKNGVQHGRITRDLHDEYRIQGDLGGGIAYVEKSRCFASETEAKDAARTWLTKQRDQIDRALAALER